MDHRLTGAEHLGFVGKCIKLKADIAYGPDYVLVVVVDDYIPFRDERDVKTLSQFVAKLLPNLNLNFARLFLLGASGKLFLSFETTPKARRAQDKP